MTLRRLALAIPLVLAVACSSSDSDPASSDTALVADEKDAFDHGASSTLDAERALLAADSFFDFDPTLDPTKSAEANAQAVAAHVDAACAKATVTGATVTIDFGTGCTLTSGLVVSGKATVALSSAAGTLTATVTFESFAVEGTAVSGTATFATKDGSTFVVTLALTSGANAVSGKLDVVGAKGSFTTSGTLDATKTGLTSKLTLTSLLYVMGNCYPSGGTVAVTKGKVTIAYGFTASTPSTGQVTVTTGKKQTTETLPAYGSCPGTGSSWGR